MCTAPDFFGVPVTRCQSAHCNLSQYMSCQDECNYRGLVELIIVLTCCLMSMLWPICFPECFNITWIFRSSLIGPPPYYYMYVYIHIYTLRHRIRSLRSGSASLRYLHNQQAMYVAVLSLPERVRPDGTCPPPQSLVT